MAKKSHKVTQVKAHCGACLQNSMVDPKVIGRAHRKHNDPEGLKENRSRWVAGEAPKDAKPLGDVQIPRSNVEKLIIAGGLRRLALVGRSLGKVVPA